MNKLPTSTINILLAGVFGLAGLWLYSAKPASTPVTPDVPIVVDNTLDGFKAIVASAGPAKVKAIGNLFAAMGDVVSRNPGLQTSVVRSWIVDSQTYYVKGTDLAGGIGIGGELNKVFAAKLGTDDRELSESETKQLASLLLELASICGVK